MKLYFSPGSCALAPHIVLEEMGLSYESERVNMREKTLANGESYLKISPKGQVPTLITDQGHLLTEGAVISQYLCDLHPEKSLLPKGGTWERTKANEWLNYVATEMHKTLGAFFSIDRIVTQPEGNQQWRQGTLKVLGQKFDYLSEHLSKNKFLMGSDFTAADAYLFTVLSWHSFLKIDLKPWPKLVSYLEQIHSRPAVLKAMKSQGLL